MIVPNCFKEYIYIYITKDVRYTIGAWTFKIMVIIELFFETGFKYDRETLIDKVRGSDRFLHTIPS